MTVCTLILMLLYINGVSATTNSYSNDNVIFFMSSFYSGTLFTQ